MKTPRVKNPHAQALGRSGGLAKWRKVSAEDKAVIMAAVIAARRKHDQTGVGAEASGEETPGAGLAPLPAEGESQGDHAEAG